MNRNQTRIHSCLTKPRVTLTHDSDFLAFIPTLSIIVVRGWEVLQNHVLCAKGYTGDCLESGRQTRQGRGSGWHDVLSGAKSSSRGCINPTSPSVWVFTQPIEDKLALQSTLRNWALQQVWRVWIFSSVVFSSFSACGSLIIEQIRLRLIQLGSLLNVTRLCSEDERECIAEW